MKPLIAVTTSELGCRVIMDGFDSGPGGVMRTAVPDSYLQAVENAGGIPVLVAPMSPELADEALERFDGLLFAGGPDVGARLYGMTDHPTTKGVVERADEVETALLAAAEARGLPVLGVCRGMQLLNVHRGGTLRQHIFADDHSIDEHRLSDSASRHPVSIDERSILAHVFGTELEVNSLHHQAADRLGSGLRAVAWAPDGTVEAVQDDSRGFIVGVQWHPETMPTHLPLIERFVDACAFVLPSLDDDQPIGRVADLPGFTVSLAV